jgi:hypothetical protein
LPTMAYVFDITVSASLEDSSLLTRILDFKEDLHRECFRSDGLRCGGRRFNLDVRELFSPLQSGTCQIHQADREVAGAAEGRACSTGHEALTIWDQRSSSVLRLESGKLSRIPAISERLGLALFFDPETRADLKFQMPGLPGQPSSQPFPGMLTWGGVWITRY